MPKKRPFRKRRRQQEANRGETGKGKKNQNIGRSSGGLSSKVHGLCDAWGYPLKFIITEGQRHDSTAALALLEGTSGDYVLADTAYDAESILERIKQMRAEAVIRPRSNRKTPREYDRRLYRERNIIERLFNRMKQFRRFATRYEKLAANFESVIYFIAIFLWIK